jgi:hypothetical protein
MPRIDGRAYRGRIGEYVLMPAAAGDAEELARMYAGIAITAENYREKLCPGRPGNFKDGGGMFIIHNKESILAEIGRSLFCLMKDKNGAIAASFWVAESDPAFEGKGRFDNPDGLTVYSRELIVLRHSGDLSVSRIMFYTVSAAMKKLGYARSLGEVYLIAGYEDAEGMHEADMLNERSFRALLNAGWRDLGQNDPRTADIGGVTVFIRPRIVGFDYAVDLPLLEQKLASEGIKAKFIEKDSAL